MQLLYKRWCCARHFNMPQSSQFSQQVYIVDILIYIILDDLTKTQLQLTAATAKSLQSCPTLRDPRDGSPPGSSVPGIIQARTLEWVAIPFSRPQNLKSRIHSGLLARCLGIFFSLFLNCLFALYISRNMSVWRKILAEDAM